MATMLSPDASYSMIMSGSIVSVVGIIFLVTVDVAFIMMIAFGAAVVALGLFTSRRSRTQSEGRPERRKDG